VLIKPIERLSGMGICESGQYDCGAVKEMGGKTCSRGESLPAGEADDQDFG
jgi:hypothetical protein